MTDTRSPRSMDEDQSELLAELDELFPDSSSDERHLGHSADGAIAFGQDADDMPADELGELEALFDTFYEDGEMSPEQGSETTDVGSGAPADDRNRDKSLEATHSAERQEGTVAKEDVGSQDNPLDAPPGVDVTLPAAQQPLADSVKGMGPSEELNHPGGHDPEMPASTDEAGGVAQGPSADPAKVTGLLEAGINLKDTVGGGLAGTSGVIPTAPEPSVDAAKEAGASEEGLDIDEKENSSGAPAGVGDVEPDMQAPSVEQTEVPGASGGEQTVTEEAAGSGGVELQEGASGTGDGEPGPAGEAADAPALEDTGGAAAQNGSVAPAAGNTEPGATASAEDPRVPALESEGAGDAVALPGDASAEPQREETDAPSAVPAGARDGAVTSPPEEAEDSDGGLFPFVPPGTVVDGPPPRTSLALTAQSVPVREAGMSGKIALAAGALGLLIAGGAGWLAWKAQEEVAAMHERIGSLQPAAPAADQDTNSGTFGNRLADLTRRVDTLAATDGAGDREEIAAVKSELKLLTERFGGLDARLEALRARLGSGSSPVAAEEAKPKPARPGRWAVNLASFADQATARSELKRIRGLGIDAEVASAPADGRTWYRIRVPGFASASEAKKFVRKEAAPAGFGEAWVGPQ